MNKSAFRLISNTAQGFTKKVAIDVRGEMNSILERFATEAIKESSPENVANHFARILQTRLNIVKDRWGKSLGVKGYKIASRVVNGVRGSSLMVLGVKASPQGVISVTPDSAFSADELIANHLDPAVADWIRETSKWETETSAKRYEKLYRDAFAFGEESGGLAPGALHSRIVDQGLAYNKARAELMGRTISNWGFNEGSITLYEDTGVTQVEWLSVLDNVTGEWDAELNGTQIPIRSNFVRANEVFLQSDGAELSVPFDIPHPPLHPHCRCTIIPVL